MDDVHRIHFESTLDEIVEVNLRLTPRTQSFRAYRARAVWVAGGCLSAGVLAMVFIRARQADVDVSAAIWGVVLAAALARGAGFGYVYGLYVDWAMRRQYRRVIAEQLGGTTNVRCDIELRREGVWVVQKGLEITLPWSNAAGIEDTGDAIELRFSPGLVVARNRAFRDALDRARFLERARELASEFKARTE